jgi:predicted alpha/beta-fold hydrolase
MRTCGGTQRLCRTLYHAGLTGDLLAVLREFRSQGRAPAFLVGFSLGGNVVLKLAGEMGESAREYVRGICTVSAPLDLAACARRIGERDNRVYEARFVRAMRKRLCATGRYQMREFEGVRSVYELDDRFTAPSFGFGDAANYYRTQSAIGYLGGLRVPALLIQAKDDTFVPFAIYESAAVRSNPWIELMATECGGHLGFIGCGPNRLWSDEAIMEWIAGTIVKQSSYQPSKVLRSK